MGVEAGQLIGRVTGAASAVALPAAFERLFLEEYPRVAAIAFRVLGDRAEAEDVAQEVLLAFYRHHAPDASYAAPWLRAAAAHAALNVIRGRKRRERRETIAAMDQANAVADPEEDTLAGERRAEVRATLGRLPPQVAALLALRYSGLSYAEVASALGLKTDQVGTRLRRAQEAFRREVRRGSAQRT